MTKYRIIQKRTIEDFDKDYIRVILQKRFLLFFWWEICRATKINPTDREIELMILQLELLADSDKNRVLKEID